MACRAHIRSAAHARAGRGYMSTKRHLVVAELELGRILRVGAAVPRALGPLLQRLQLLPPRLCLLHGVMATLLLSSCLRLCRTKKLTVSPLLLSSGGHHQCDCSTLKMRIMLWIAACATASAFAPSPAPFGLTAGSRAQVITVVPRGQCHCAGGAAVHASADGLRRPRHTDSAVARSSSGATATLCSPVLAPVSLSVRAHLSRVEHSQLIIDCVLAVHRGIRTAHTRPTSR